MKYAYSTLALSLTASAAVVSRQTTQCCFQLKSNGTASGQATGTLGQLADGQNRVGPSYTSPATYCIQNGGLTDGSKRGCILTPPTTQFQCDVGATPTTGFTISSTGGLLANGTNLYYACAADGNNNFNIYTKAVAGSYCVPITLTTVGGACSGSGVSSSSSAPASSASSSRAASASSSAAASSSATSASSSKASSSAAMSSSAASASSSKASSSAVASSSSSAASASSSKASSSAVASTSAASASSSKASSSAIVSSSASVVTASSAKSSVASSVASSSASVPVTVTVTKPVTVTVTAPCGASSTVPVGPGSSSVPISSSPKPSTPASASSTPVAASSVASSNSKPASSTPVAASSLASSSKPASSTPVVPSSVASSTPVASSSAASSSKPASSTPVASSSMPASSSKASSSAPPASSTPAPPASSTTVASKSSSASATTSSAKSTSTCPLDLTGNWQYPHLIVPVNSSSPSTAYGTSYFGKVSSTVSSIFNFDIPASYAGKTCTVVFSLPMQAQLQTSSFTLSGAGSVDFKSLAAVATQSTSYANAPAVKSDLGTHQITPGSAVTVTSGACAAGTAVAYELVGTGSLALDYFQDYNPCPIGLYVIAA